MRKRQFTPTVDGRLEDRVVLSAVGPINGAYAPLAVSQKDLNNTLNRMHDAFVRAMNDFNKEFRAVVNAYGWHNGGNNGGYVLSQSNGYNAGIARLQRAALRVGYHLGNDLAAAVHGLPWAQRDLAPTLKQIGQNVGREISCYTTLAQMQSSGRTAFLPGWVDAKCFVIDSLRGDHLPE